MNTPTDKELRDWYMGYGVEGRVELAEVEGEAFDRYLVERDAKVAKATEERILKLLKKKLFNTVYKHGKYPAVVSQQHFDGDIIALIEGETK